ncbi:MAG: 3-oxoacyl-ACP reductase family protein [Acidobacteriota bacterium]|nr:3-oxoacyl-ACP reductase family protein [Acidobacteriota bacterium]
MIDLKGKVAVVTGGSRGIGRACSVLLARAGADVVIGYRGNEKAASDTAVAVEAEGRRVLTVAGDLADAEAAQLLFTRARDAFGRVNIVVANAGIWKHAPIDTMTTGQWRETISANLDSLYQTCHFAARIMKQQKSGKLIIIASTAGQRGEAEYAHYAASKGAAIAMTRSLGSELGPYGINVNCVAPGWVLTDMTTDVFENPEFRQSIEQSIPVRRIASPEDIAGPVLFLASELSRHLQGSILSVNGGSVMA